MHRILIGIVTGAALALVLSIPAFGAGTVVYGGVQSPVVCQSAVKSGVGGTLSETTIATCTIPAGKIGPNGALRLTYRLSYTGLTNNKTYAIKWGGSTLMSKTRNGASQINDALQLVWMNRGSESSQVELTNSAASASFSATNGTAQQTYSINTALDTTFSITGTTTLEAAKTTTAITGNGAQCTATVSSHGLANGRYIKASGASNCSTSGSPNADPVVVAITDANTFVYPCTCNGTEAGTQATIEAYSEISVESYTVEVLR